MRHGLPVLIADDTVRHGSQVKDQEVTFLKKVTKKPFFVPLRAVVKHPGTKTIKVFLLLFVHKKKFFLLMDFVLGGSHHELRT